MASILDREALSLPFYLPSALSPSPFRNGFFFLPHYHGFCRRVILSPLGVAWFPVHSPGLLVHRGTGLAPGNGIPGNPASQCESMLAQHGSMTLPNSGHDGGGASGRRDKSSRQQRQAPRRLALVFGGKKGRAAEKAWAYHSDEVAPRRKTCGRFPGAEVSPARWSQGFRCHEVRTVRSSSFTPPRFTTPAREVILRRSLETAHLEPPQCAEVHLLGLGRGTAASPTEAGGTGGAAAGLQRPTTRWVGTLFAERRSVFTEEGRARLQTQARNSSVVEQWPYTFAEDEVLLWRSHDGALQPVPELNISLLPCRRHHHRFAAASTDPIASTGPTDDRDAATTSTYTLFTPIVSSEAAATASPQQQQRGIDATTSVPDLPWTEMGFQVIAFD